MRYNRQITLKEQDDLLALYNVTLRELVHDRALNAAFWHAVNCVHHLTSWPYGTLEDNVNYEVFKQELEHRQAKADMITLRTV